MLFECQKNDLLSFLRSYKTPIIVVLIFSIPLSIHERLYIKIMPEIYTLTVRFRTNKTNTNYHSNNTLFIWSSYYYNNIMRKNEHKISFI